MSYKYKVDGCRCHQVGQYVLYNDQNQGETTAKVIGTCAHILTLELTLRTNPPRVVQYTEQCNHPSRLADLPQSLHEQSE